MGTRHERVVLTLEDSNLSSGFARATGHAVAFKKSLADLNDTSVSSARSLRVAEQQVDSLGAATRRSGADLDSYTSRLGLLGTTVLALGPSILPVAAAAVPALASVTAGMAAASVGAVALMLAFNGIGDAVTAVSEYKLDPTSENLERLRTTLEEFGPAGSDFVMKLDELKPALDDLQRLSRQGFFPGAGIGLDAVASKLPGIRNLIADVSEATGRLAASAGTSLTSDSDWEEFFDFLGDNAATDLETFGRATGNLIAGTANLVEALGSLDGADAGILDMSRSFREWADGIEQTEGWRDFADYVKQSGPQVADLLSATADAVVALAEAAAPWASVVVPALTTGAEAFAAIAGSPIGPVLFATAAGLLAISKASALVGPRVTQASAALASARTNVTQLGADLKTVSGGWVLASSASQREAAAMGAATNRIKGNLASIGKGAAIVGSASLLASGAADKMGVTNAVMLGMAGSLAGPWGAAAGAAVGLTLDLAHANDDLKDSLDAANTAMRAGGLTEMSAAVKQLRADLQETNDADIWGFDLGDGFGARISEVANVITPLTNVKKVMGGLTGETDKAAAALEKLKGQKAALEDVAVAMGANRDSAAEMSSGVDRAQEAMDKLGISANVLRIAQQTGGVEFDLLTGRIQDYIAAADSTAGRTGAVGDAIANLGNDAISTADSATQLNTALQALFAPTLNLEAATDQWRASLKALREDLNADAGFSSFTEAGRKNNELTRAYVTDSMERLTALADISTTTEADMARAVGKTREEFIKSGVAAGFSRKEISARADAMGLTPDLVKTIFENAGIDESERKARSLRAAYNALPLDVRTDIKLNGVPKSAADMRRLQKTYGLTQDEVKTIAQLRDNASLKIQGVKAELAGLDGRTATTTITTVMRTVEQTAAINRERANGGFQENGRLAFADGGYGENGRYYSRTPQIIPGGANILWGERSTGWEAYISGKPSEKQRNLEILAMAADRLGAAVIPAAIGRITPYAKGGSGGTGGTPGRRDPVAAALWQSGHRDPKADLIAGMTVRQLARLGRAFDDLSGKRLTRFGRGLERAATLQEKQTDKARDRFETVRDRRSEIGSSIATGLRSDLWADTGGSAFSQKFAAGSIGGATSLLNADTGKAKQFNKDIAILRKKGLNGDALQEIIGSGDTDRARMFASGTKSQLQTYESAYNARQGATAAAGRLGGQVLTPEFNALRGELSKQLAQQQTMNKQLSLLRKEQDRRHDAAQKSRKDNGAGPAARRGARG